MNIGNRFLAALFAVLLLVAVIGAVAPNDTGEDRLVLTQVPAGTRDPASRDLPEGARVVTFDPRRASDGTTVLTPGFAAAGRPDVSFDGTRVLFVGRRRPKDPVAVWEVPADATGLRKVAEGPADCIAAIYLSTLYCIDAERPEHRICFASGGALFTCRNNGTDVRRITFEPSGTYDPFLLSDGRLLMSVGGAAGAALLTIHVDGTDLSAFAAVDEPPAARGMPCETADGRVVYVEADAGGADRGGDLLSVSRTRSLVTRRVVARDPAGQYLTPSLAPDGELLVSFRTRESGTYGVHPFDVERGSRGAAILDTPEWHEIDASALAPHREPAGRSSVVKKGAHTGRLYCLDVGITDGEARGPARRVRVLARSGNAETILGEAIIEADGSFHLEIPARTLIRLETLDPEGRVVRAMQSRFWVMPNEARGCIGCHEDRELTPPNRNVFALRRPPDRIGLDASEEGR